ncbi:MAG TPA: TonB-dependent receptor [Gemmatimonadales bacterium]|nr:TonB-dependent receptor [Gemmatimonadales bacterium]
MNTMHRSRLCGFVLLGALALSAPSLMAQQGSVAGRVTDKVSSQPIPGAAVLLSGTNLQATTNNDGRYHIDRVPPGQYQAQVRLIGYAMGQQPVTVTAGGTATLDIVMTAAAISLDALVVSATGETQRVKELGNAVASIRADSVAAKAPVTNIADLLNSRSPGVQVITPGGTTGDGTRIRIRGDESLSLDNEPVVMVDGIRVNNSPRSSSIGVGGQIPSRIDDFQSNDLENVDIVKGPSAAALYGTDAANGVIQFRTKQGRPGPTRWTSFIEGGVLNDDASWPANYRGLTAAGGGCSLEQQAAGLCTVVKLQTLNPIEQFSPFRQGMREQYGVSASGGSEATTFYTSGTFERERGVFESNDLRRVSLRANLHNQLSQLMDISVSTGYVSSDLTLPQNDNNDQGIVSSGLLGTSDTSRNFCAQGHDCHGYGFLTPQEANQIFTGQSIERFTGSLNLNFRPTSFLTFRGVAGTDVTNQSDNETTPPAVIPLDQDRFDGNHVADRIQVFSYTANFSGTANYRLTSTITANTTAGVQYVKDVDNEVDASGRKLVGGTNSLAGVVVPTVGEVTNEFVTLGFYGQEQVNFHDRFFVTAAVRRDKNSAFGVNFSGIAYPKLSASWVLSDEPFFIHPSWLNSLRLRAAWGRSGRQPGETDALQFFSPVAVTTNGGSQPAVTIGGLGNTTLKPERTQEIETGFDADMAQSRLHLEFTYYDKTSKDALIARKLAPSLGVTDTRFENLGEVSNKGVELLLTAQVITTPSFGWSVSASAWGNRNRLIHLGQGITPIIFGLGGASQRHEEGYPLGGYWDYSYTFQDKNNDGLIDASEITVAANQTFQGSVEPDHGGTLTSDVTFLRHFRLYGLLDARYGNKLDNATEEFRCLFGICRGNRDPKASLAEQAASVATRNFGIETPYFQDASFVKLREVSLTYSAPEQWARKIGASTLSFTVTGRNLHTWTKYKGVDPEVINGLDVGQFSTADFLTQPPVRYFIGRVNVTF